MWQLPFQLVHQHPRVTEWLPTQIVTMLRSRTARHPTTLPSTFPSLERPLDKATQVRSSIGSLRSVIYSCRLSVTSLSLHGVCCIVTISPLVNGTTFKGFMCQVRKHNDTATTAIGLFTTFDTVKAKNLDCTTAKVHQLRMIVYSLRNHLLSRELSSIRTQMMCPSSLPRGKLRTQNREITICESCKILLHAVSVQYELLHIVYLSYAAAPSSK